MDTVTEKRNGHGGKREGAGRPPGAKSALPQGGWKKLREAAQAHTEKAIQALAECLDDEDPWVRMAAADKLLDRGYGKPKEHFLVENNDMLALRYQTFDELRAELEAAGMSDEHLRQPNLIEYEPPKK